MSKIELIKSAQAKSRMASVGMTRYGFYEAMENGDREEMASWFETMYWHYQQRGKKSKK